MINQQLARQLYIYGKTVLATPKTEGIKYAGSKYILLSYSSGGRATKQELNDIISESGKLLKLVEIDYRKNIMANMRWTNQWINGDGKHCKYLFLMEKAKHD